MIDAGLVYDAKTAIQRRPGVQPYNPFWFEEPLLPDDYWAMPSWPRASPLRIAAGEEESERKSFLQLMDVGQIDVVQVDLTRCGGFTEAMKIAALAADRGLPIVNHGFTTYLNVAAALHFLASIPNTLGTPRVRRRGGDQPSAVDHRRSSGPSPAGSPSRMRPVLASSSTRTGSNVPHRLIDSSDPAHYLRSSGNALTEIGSRSTMTNARRSSDAPRAPAPPDRRAASSARPTDRPRSFRRPQLPSVYPVRSVDRPLAPRSTTC